MDENWLRENRPLLLENGVPSECVRTAGRWDRLLCEGEDVESGWLGHWPSPAQCRELLRVIEPECMDPQGGWGNELLFRMRSRVWQSLPERSYVALPLADMAREDPEAYAWPGGCTRVAVGEDLSLASELFQSINEATGAAISAYEDEWLPVAKAKSARAIVADYSSPADAGLVSFLTDLASLLEHSTIVRQPLLFRL